MCKRKGYGESSLAALVSIYRTRARRYSHSFTLLRDEGMRLLSSPCHYCGAPPAKTYHRPGGYGECLYNGLDRVDNAKGYEPGNVVPCCTACNLAKGMASGEQFLAWALSVARHQGWTSMPGLEVLPRQAIRHGRGRLRAV